MNSLIEIVKCRIAVNDVQTALAVNKEATHFFAVYRQEANSSKNIIKKEIDEIDVENAIKVIFQLKNDLHVDNQSFLTTTKLYIDERANNMIDKIEINYKELFKKIGEEELAEQRKWKETEDYKIMTLNNKEELEKLAEQAKKNNDFNLIFRVRANCNMRTHFYKDLLYKVEKIYEEIRNKK